MSAWRGKKFAVCPPTSIHYRLKVALGHQLLTLLTCPAPSRIPSAGVTGGLQGRPREPGRYQLHVKTKTKSHTRHDHIASGMFSGTSHLLNMAPKRTHNFPHHHPTPKLLLLLLLHFLLHAPATSFSPIERRPLFYPLSLTVPGSLTAFHVYLATICSAPEPPAGYCHCFVCLCNGVYYFLDKTDICQLDSLV